MENLVNVIRGIGRYDVTRLYELALINKLHMQVIGELRRHRVYESDFN